MAPDDPLDPAAELARTIAEAAARPGTPPDGDGERIRALVAALAGDPDGDRIEAFFDRLARELRARGATLPPCTELPASLAPLLAAAEVALAPEASGELDADAVAARLDRAVARELRVPDREQRRAQRSAAIRGTIADRVAASLRRRGLTPAAEATDPAED
jgi:hypothetical protein